MQHRKARLNRLFRAIAAATLTASLVTIAPASAHAAPEPDVCSSQIAALESVEHQIDVHNGEPHTFKIPAQEAQAEAYDAEAAELNADLKVDRGAVEACAAAMEALGDDGPDSPGYQAPTKEQLDAINQAKANIPENWKPQPAPPAGKNWQVSQGSKERPLYDTLRGYSPRDAHFFDGVPLQGQMRPAVGNVDPAYLNGTYVANTNAEHPGSAASPDHVVPLAEIVYMPGFMQLNAENMYLITNVPFNFQWLSWKANRSKQSRSVATIIKMDPAWRDQQTQMENRIRGELLKIIANLVKSQRAKK